MSESNIPPVITSVVNQVWRKWNELTLRWKLRILMIVLLVFIWVGHSHRTTSNLPFAPTSKPSHKTAQTQTPTSFPTEIPTPSLTDDRIPAPTPALTPIPIPHSNMRYTLGRNYIEDLGSGIKLEMVWIPGGTSMIGSTDEKQYTNWPFSVYPPTRVELSGFWMGKYEVTQEQYQQIMGFNPSLFKGARNPVDSVSWDNANLFCKRIREWTGQDYELPTDPQWEYACRAGTSTRYYFGDTLSTDQANYNGIAYEITAMPPYEAEKTGIDRGKPIEVGSFPPNAFGLYDMHGNVREWCFTKKLTVPNQFLDSPWGDAKPKPNQSQIDRIEFNYPELNYYVARGGSWMDENRSCESSMRTDGGANVGDPHAFIMSKKWSARYGFRVVSRGEIRPNQGGISAPQ